MKVGGDFPPSDGAGDNGAEWQDMGEKPILETDPSGDNGDVEASQEGDSEQLEGWDDELEAAVQVIFDGKESKYFFIGQIKGLDGGRLSIDSVRDYIRGLDDDEKKNVVRRFKVVNSLSYVNPDNLVKACHAFTGISDGEFNLKKFFKDSSTDNLETVLRMARSQDSGESPEKAAASGEMSGDSGEAKTRKDELIEQIRKMSEERDGSFDGEKLKDLSEEKLKLIIDSFPLFDRLLDRLAAFYPMSLQKEEIIKKAGLWERLEKIEKIDETEISEEALNDLKGLVEGLEKIDFSSVDDAPIIEASSEDNKTREPKAGEAAFEEPRYEDLSYEELVERVGSNEWLDADYREKTVADYIRDFNYSKADLELALRVADCTEEISGLLGLTSLNDTITDEVWNKILESGLEQGYSGFLQLGGSIRTAKAGLDSLKSFARSLRDAGFPVASGASESSLESDKDNPEKMKNGESGAEDQEAKEKASLIESLTPTTEDEIVFIAKHLGLDGKNAAVDKLNKALEGSDIAKLSELKRKLEEFRKKPEDSTGEGGRSPEELARREKAIAGLENYFTNVRESVERSNIPTEQLELDLRKIEYASKLAEVYNNLSDSEQKQVATKFPWLVAYEKDARTWGTAKTARKYSEDQFKEVITFIESIKGGAPDTGREAGAESRESKEKAQLIREFLESGKPQATFVANKLGFSVKSTPIAEINDALEKMEIGKLRELKAELEAYMKKAEGNGEADTSPERLETLRKMTFGVWFHEVYGGAKSEKWPEDSFFAAPIEKQREAMARYMDMFDADARLEADRKYIVEELRRSDMMQKTIEEYNKDPDNKIKLSVSLTPAELEERFAKLSPDKLNKLYAAVFYGAKKGAGAASKPKPGAGAQPKPGSSAGGGSGSGADSEPHGAPDVETGGGANDEPTAEPGGEKEPTVDELVAEYAPGNMPKTNDELLTRMKDVPDIKLSISRAGGEEAFASETMKHIQVWSRLPEVARRGVLERGTSSLNGDMNALESVVYLQRVGFLPRTLYGN